MREIWLIRHAESLGNAGEKTDLPHSIPLTDLGHRQAKELAERIPRAPDLIVVSRYQRTTETARPTIKRFPQSPVVEWPIHEFTFLTPQHYQGKTQADRRGPALAFWERCQPDYCDGEGAESFNAFMSRIRDCTDRLRNSSERFIAVFTHGYVIKAMLWDSLNQGNRSPDQFMRGFQQFLGHVSVENGTILPLLANDAGQLFVGSPIMDRKKNTEPSVGDRLD